MSELEVRKEAVQYRPARTIKMPRNELDKKSLDVGIGSANLPVSLTRLIGRNALAAPTGEEGSQ